MILRFAAAVSAAALLLVPGPAEGAPRAPIPCSNAVYLTRDDTLLRLDGSGEDAEPTPVAEFDAPLDAVAYVPETHAFWALSGEHVIGFDQTGRVVKRTPKPPALIPTDPITAASGGTGAGAGSGDRWIVRTGREVVTYRMPALKEVARHTLTGPGADILLRPLIADWDISDGQLYTIVAGWLTRVDPHTGIATPVARPPGLPMTGTFGAVAIDPQGTLRALHDQTGRLYQVTLADPTTPVTTTTVGKAKAVRSDAASCPPGWDYGDAPAPYPTRRAADGPRHLITAGLSLGRTVTPETDAAKRDSDDALAEPAEATDDGALTVRVTVTNATAHKALLAAWHDLDGNGRFDERDLRTATVRPGTTPRTVTLTWPKTNKPVPATLRIRLYGGPTGYPPPTPEPTGPGGTGEVEDHPITVRPAKPRAAATDEPLDLRDLAGPPAAIPDPGAPPVPLPARERLRQPVASTAPNKPDRLPLTWSVFVGLLVPAASVAARAAAKRGSR
ncbi:DUF6923 family protein [Asanoa iriomotensis]|uniref:Uncharacterized protein n=1 Tax=Asanoa iriomotensis TaxID=234613 RepID=A0ABQ4C9Z0_9ACTN|nr:GEVED domain-containing protein [Asanoa iriomotensis]GIF59596.1 hypothetical protein Air01nite_56910 [Asanoa iriomotensis]